MARSMLRSLAGWFVSPRPARVGSRRPGFRVRPEVEPLECRLTPSGGLLATGLHTDRESPDLHRPGDASLEQRRPQTEHSPTLDALLRGQSSKQADSTQDQHDKSHDLQKDKSNDQSKETKDQGQSNDQGQNSNDQGQSNDQNQNSNDPSHS
jgi:hypothetical protein